MRHALVLTLGLCAAACSWPRSRNPSAHGPFCYGIVTRDPDGQATILPAAIAFLPEGDGGQAIWLPGPQPSVTDGARAVLRGWGTSSIRVTLSTPRFGAELDLHPVGRTLVGRGHGFGDVGPWVPRWVPVTAKPRTCPAAVEGASSA